MIKVSSRKIKRKPKSFGAKVVKMKMKINGFFPKVKGMEDKDKDGRSNDR